MISLELALIFFLVLACGIFSLVYSFVDNHNRKDTISDYIWNLRTYVLALLAAGVLINILQEVFGS